ncbi:hypothetical protein BCR33DRAFT_716695 [Rhizoclosmatium globosum]|uniref:WW domain-containing protein n=1 Tax=Rhizoclosmatium globosum TaxID=329046 RepID=A0A1Y2CCG8_9FUNG|nr:hypothetical protein BCR33DRAFT_716695 [Rhizoclosmatium globosum]|eukprot:ORY44728.1 hypothetical protein BCR33DRAFT_716695 [Rhizoclosmatium globosum]
MLSSNSSSSKSSDQQLPHAATTAVLPPGWVAQWSPEFQRYFFANTFTGVTQWDVPVAGGFGERGVLVQPLTPPSASTAISTTSTQQNSNVFHRIDSLVSTLAAAIPRISIQRYKVYEAPPLPQGWIAQWSIEHNRWFFVNTLTCQSQWELPQSRAEDEPLPEYKPNA